MKSMKKFKSHTNGRRRRSCELTGEGVVNVKGRTKEGWRSRRIRGWSSGRGTVVTAAEGTASLRRCHRHSSGGSAGLALLSLQHPSLSLSRDFRVCDAILICPRVLVGLLLEPTAIVRVSILTAEITIITTYDGFLLNSKNILLIEVCFHLDTNCLYATLILLCIDILTFSISLK